MKIGANVKVDPIFRVLQGFVRIVINYVLNARDQQKMIVLLAILVDKFIVNILYKNIFI